MNKKRSNCGPAVDASIREACDTLGIDAHFNRCINCPNWRRYGCKIDKTIKAQGKYALWCHPRAYEFFTTDPIVNCHIDEVKGIFSRAKRESVMWYLSRIAKSLNHWRGRTKYVAGECEEIANYEREVCPNASNGELMQGVYVGSFTCRHLCQYARTKGETRRGEPVYCAYKYCQQLADEIEAMRLQAIKSDVVGDWMQYYMMERKLKRLLGQ